MVPKSWLRTAFSARCLDGWTSTALAAVSFRRVQCRYEARTGMLWRQTMWRHLYRSDQDMQEANGLGFMQVGQRLRM